MTAEKTPARAGPDRRGQDLGAQDLCVRIAEQTGAFGRCEAGHPGHVRRLHDRAEVRAFAALIDAHKAGETDASLDALMRALTALLDATPPACPYCAAERRSDRV